MYSSYKFDTEGLNYDPGVSIDLKRTDPLYPSQQVQPTSEQSQKLCSPHWQTMDSPGITLTSMALWYGHWRLDTASLNRLRNIEHPHIQLECLS